MVLLKIDFYLITAFLAVYSVPVLQYRGIEFVFNTVFDGTTLVVFLLAVVWTKREYIVGMILAMVSFEDRRVGLHKLTRRQVYYLATLGYFVYKLIIMYADDPHHYMFEASLDSLTLYGGLSTAFLCFTICNAMLCTRNSGLGLKTHLTTTNRLSADGSLSTFHPLFDANSQNLTMYNRPVSRLSLE